MVAQLDEHWTCSQQNGLTLGQASLCINFTQVVHTYVVLSPSGIIWYKPKGNDA